MVRKTIACVGLLALLLGSGAGAGFAQTTPAALEATAKSGAYTLGPGDKLQITVYGEEDLSSEQQVGPDGSVAIPLIGRVVATGRTTTALTEEIRSKLAEGFVQNPSVTVTITTYRPFYILGEVNTPGQYEYANGMTVMSAVARAGGFTYRAKKNEVFVKHEGGQEERVKLTGDLPIQPGDTIRVGERYF